jgi:hypothetical protein
MSNAAVLARPQEEMTETGWIELDDLEGGLLGFEPVESDVEFTEMDPPVVAFDDQQAMRFGPRSYTTEQADVIQLAVRQRKPLPVEPLPFDE